MGWGEGAGSRAGFVGAILIALVMFASGCGRGGMAARVEREVSVDQLLDESKSAYSERHQRMENAVVSMTEREREALAVDVLRGRQTFRDANLERVYWSAALSDMMARDRWSLVRDVLVKKPLSAIDMFVPEFYIAQHGVERLGVLCEAYANTQSQAVKEGIATCFRRGFASEGEGVCDRVLVERCQSMMEYWGGRKINMDYPHLPASDGQGPEGLLLKSE